ncbi:hypothetical protein ACFQ0M_30530 [Kitasatospora aburaviensis]
MAAEEDRLDVFGAVRAPVHDPDPAVREGELRGRVPLPSVAETASPAVRLAEGLSEPAQAVLRLAVALGGECPTAPHLPALIDVGQGESALHELADAGLAVSIGGHHRLTAGALELLAPQWPARGCTDGAAQHFAWWVGHSSVSLEQIAAEAEVVIGVLLADRTAGRHASVVRLARAAAPRWRWRCAGAPGSGCWIWAWRRPARPVPRLTRPGSTTSWACSRFASRSPGGRRQSWRPH